MTDLLDRVSPERKDVILARAEALVREERGRRGRFAPESNRHVAGPSDFWRYLQGVAMGCAAGLILGYFLGLAFPQRSACNVSATAAHVSVCLDGQIAKLKELRR